MFVGIQESMVDYPGKMCVMLFTRGCSWDCPGCYNKASLASARPLGWDYVRSYLMASKGLTRYVTISGGEPTEDEDLLPALRWLCSSGFSVKLDTNGSHPDVLGTALPYLSVVAMDVKDDPSDDQRYRLVTRNPLTDVGAVRESIRMLSEWYGGDPVGRTLIYRTTLFTDGIDTDGVRDFLDRNGFGRSDYVIQDDVRSARGKVVDNVSDEL